MKYLIFINIIAVLWTAFHKIETTNTIKDEAAKAFKLKDFHRAAILYESLIKSYHLDDEKIRLNFANALYLNNERKRASVEYMVLTNSSNPQTSAIAFQQLGILAALKGKYESALADFKQSLKTDPDNEKARYNYELVKKIYDEEVSLQSKLRKNDSGNEKEKDISETGIPKNRETLIKQLNSTGSNQSSMGEGDNAAGLFNKDISGIHEMTSDEIDPTSKEEEKELEADKKGNRDMSALKSKRLNEIKISEDKAKMILELMKNKEIQYLQERRRVNSNKEYKNKPDW